MPLPPFRNEAEFRSNWIAPFLSKIGYVQINHIHGSGEQGKDFFFADYDRFEYRRFYAVQAKNGNIGAGQRELDDLLNQVRRSFTVKLRFHKEAHERHVSAVYIMASGGISKEAREYISDWCQSNSFGENVYYLDGDTLERLDKFAFQRSDLDLRNKLIGLLNECNHNLQMIEQIRFYLNKKIKSIVKCRTFSIDMLLLSPPPDDILSTNFLINTSTALQTLDTLSTWKGDIGVYIPDTYLLIHTQALESALQLTTILTSLAFQAIQKLDLKYSISVEIVESVVPMI